MHQRCKEDARKMHSDDEGSSSRHRNIKAIERKKMHQKQIFFNAKIGARL